MVAIFHFYMNYEVKIDVADLQFFIFYFQILMFDSVNGRTCLHYAAYYGHSDCLQAILSAARSSHVAASWWVLSLSLWIDSDNL